jgi:hypothetical protein
MNEQSGTIVDYSGEGNNGTNNGATYGAGGKFDTALEFDGINDYVNIDDDASLSGATKLTVELWMKTTVTGSVWYALASKHATSKREWVLNYDQGDATLRFGIYDESANAYIIRQDTSAGGYSDGNWHHIVGTWSGGTSPTNIKVYADSVQVDDATLSSGTFVAIEDLAQNVEIGRMGDAGFYFKGTIDEVAIYNRSLSAEEIFNHYKRGVLRLNISARSCNDPACSGETYDVHCENASFCNLSSLSNNRYFQYKVNLKTDDVNYTPELIANSVIISYETYSIESVNYNTGAEQNEFDATESVCVSGTADSDGSDIWVCGNRTWGGGENLTDIGCVKNATGVTDTFNKLNLGTKNIGYYDLVLDLDQNGIYDTATDVLDDADILDTAGFYITPEPLSLILFALGLIVLYGFIRIKKKPKST